MGNDVRAAIDWCLAGGDTGRAVALAAPHPRAASNILDAVTWADAVLAAGSAVPDRDRFVLHIVAAEGKMLHAVQPSAAYPDIDAAIAIGPGDDAQAVMLRRVLALQTWMRERDSDAMVAHANAEGSIHPADNALDHFSAALLLGLADRDPQQHLSRGDALLTGCGRTNVFRAVPLAAVAHWLARRGRDDAVPLFLQAMAEARSLPPGPIRSIVAALASGGLASLDPASARQILLELIDPDRGDLVSPSDIVRAAIGTVLYLDATGRPDDRSEILSRTLFLPGAPRLVDVFAPEVDHAVPLLPGTHLELLERMRTFLSQPPSTHEELPVN